MDSATLVRVVDSPEGYANASSCPAGVYHSLAWGDAYTVYQLRVDLLVAERDGSVVGWAPLVRQSSRIFGERFISLPWVDEAGIHGPAEVVDAIAEYAAGLAQRQSAYCQLILKQPISGEPPSGNQWATAAADKTLMRLRLRNSADELWKALSAKVRNQVRKAEKSGLKTERGGIELVDEFYEVYARNMRDLGSPSHSRRFFRLLTEGLGDLATVYCTRHEGKSVGAGIALNNGASLDIPWASSLRDYNRMCVNHGMYWKILSDACEAGYEWFHFGRSTIGSGQHKFKKQWGAEEVPLNWWVYRPEGSTSSASSSAKPDAGFGLAQDIWRRLPVWLTKRLGPLVIRHVM